MKVRCKVCGEWFEKENLYCDHCAAKYGAERSRYDIDLFEDQRSFSQEDKEKIAKKKQSDNRPSIKTIKEKPLPDLDTMRDLRPSSSGKQGEKGKRRSITGTIRAIIFFFIFINIIMNVIADMDVDDLINDLLYDNDSSVTYEEIAVPITEYDEKASFPDNYLEDYSGSASPVNEQTIGIYEGVLSTTSYMNFDTKEMRFDLKDTDFSGEYQLPVLITITQSSSLDDYYFDVWDQNTLKMLGSYLVAVDQFFNDIEGNFEGEPAQYFYNDVDFTDLKATYAGQGLEGRLALPFTIDNEVNYFDFKVEKINDDPSGLIARSYLENERLESFVSEDGSISINFYTYDRQQGYPHSSMYYDGVMVLSDGDNGYPPIPFNLSDTGELYADMTYMNTKALTIMDKDFSEYAYYDEVDTQYYRYSPIYTEDSVYDMEFSGTLYTENNRMAIDGSYFIYNRNDGEDEILKYFNVQFVE